MNILKFTRPTPSEHSPYDKIQNLGNNYPNALITSYWDTNFRLIGKMLKFFLIFFFQRIFFLVKEIKESLETFKINLFLAHEIFKK
jgi:hypothetical protein